MRRNRSAPPVPEGSAGDPLNRIVETAYRVFAGRKPSGTGVCEQSCCMDPAIVRDFFTPPLRTLPLAYVRDWFSAAYEPDGVPRDIWTYLLPRILELLAAGEDVCPVGIELSLDRFATGKPESWSAEEWKVLDAFRRAYLARAVETGDQPLDDVLCMFSRAGWAVEDLIGQLAAMPDAMLAHGLWRGGCGGISISAFWKSPANTAVYEFYTSQALFDRMEALALADDTDPKLTAKAAAVADLIGMYRGS